MKPYLYAMGAVLCWASLPAATGSGLDGLSVPELLFFSFVPAALYLTAQEMVISKRASIPWPSPRMAALGTALSTPPCSFTPADNESPKSTNSLSQSGVRDSKE